MYAKNPLVDIVKRSFVASKIVDLIEVTREGQTHILGDGEGYQVMITKMLSEIGINDKSLSTELIETINSWPRE